MARFRRILEDYEARLAPLNTGPGRHPAGGKAEHERFEDGEVQFEVGGRGLEIADGGELEIRVNSELVARAVVRSGRISLRLSDRAGHAIPTVRAGDRIEVAHRSVVLLVGIFHPD